MASTTDAVARLRAVGALLPPLRLLGIALGYKLAVSVALLGVFAGYLTLLAGEQDLWLFVEVPAEYRAELWQVPFLNWDGGHYLTLAERGYRSDDPLRSAFYPLLPGLIAATATVAGDYFWAALLVTTACYLAFVAYLFLYLRATVSERAAVGITVAVLCFPTAFFTCLVYTESLFLALLFGFLYHYRRRPSLWCVPFALLLPLTRGQGLFVLGAVGVNLVWRLVRRRPVRYGYEACVVTAFLVGAACYFGLFWLLLGDPLAGITAQRQFVFDMSIKHLLDPGHFVHYLLTPCPDWICFNDALLDKLFILLMLAGLVPVALSRNSLHFFLYLVLVYCPAGMGHGGSFMRFALLAFPFLALACAPLWRLGRGFRWAILAVLCLGVILQLYFIGRFALHEWVG